MNEIADGLHAGPPSADGAEVRPGEIRQEVGLAISTGPQERQRIGWEVRRPDYFGVDVDLIRAAIAAKDPLKSQRRRPGRRSQPPQDVAVAVDKTLGRHCG